MTIAFHSHTMTLRGSEHALWDYANFNESLLGNRSVICHPEHLARDENPMYAKWKARFQLVSYQTKVELARKLRMIGAEALYQIKPGTYDGFIVPGLRNCIHSMFLSDEYHGDRFAYVSRWAAKVMTGHEESFVPHFVPKLESSENLRAKLGIPNGARVFGRHGAFDTFNIPFARRAIDEHARHRPADHFVFLNTEPIHGTEKLKNVHYLAPTIDPEEKAQFLATCDAMVHARWHGETFGLAVGEFAALGKPVITFGESRERAHLEMLGSAGLLYRNRNEFRKILDDFQPHRAAGTEYDQHADPSLVMRLFEEKFLG